MSRTPLPRRCALCGGAMPPPAGTGRPAKYCSPDCRRRANRGTPRILHAVADPPTETPPPADGPADDEPRSRPGDGTRRDYLALMRDRLYALLAGCPADKIPPLSKELREVLREIETLDAAAPDQKPAGRDDGPGDDRGSRPRSFDPAAV